MCSKSFPKLPPPFGVLPLLILDLMIVDFRFPPHKADASKFPTFNFYLLVFTFYFLVFSAEGELKYSLSSGRVTSSSSVYEATEKVPFWGTFFKIFIFLLLTFFK